jgi:hypothetical protein
MATKIRKQSIRSYALLLLLCSNFLLLIAGCNTSKHSRKGGQVMYGCISVAAEKQVKKHC